MRAAGVAFSFVRMSLYLDFIPFLVGAGVVRGPAGTGRLAPVLRDDLADVVVAVLLGDGHDGAAYDVTGPQTFSVAEAAATMAEVSGLPIAYEAETWSRRTRRAPATAPRRGRSTAGSPRTPRSPAASSTSPATRCSGSPATRRSAYEAYLRSHPEALAHVQR